MQEVDVQVLGSGIVGRTLALSLARAGLRVALTHAGVANPPVADVRAYALNAASVEWLRGLKVWDALPRQATTAVLDMQVHGDGPSGELEFSAWQQHVAALAWIVDAAVLERELADAVRFSPHITVVDSAAAVRAPLTAVCEGKASTTREALGIRFERHDYGQQAIAARLTSTQAHQGLARQWFRSPDVLALLPLDSPQPQHSLALVWSLPDERVPGLLAMEPDAFVQALMQATDGQAGELALASSRASWPLMWARASAWCGPGWVVLGDAAHVVHPLAGQGLNLGLADVAALVDVLGRRESWRSLGDEKLLRRYARERLAKTWAMGQLTDGLLQLFAQRTPAVRELRNRGLTLVNQLSPIKRWLAARALNS